MRDWKYLRYIIRHKWFVLLACVRRGIIWRGLVHDLSKLLPSEFYPYAEYFYGTVPNPGSDVKIAFDKAWLFHQHRNPHHWQFWILREDDGDTKIMRMSDVFVAEMVCDWIGAGRAITGKSGGTREWYEKNRHRIIVHKDTREQIEKEFYRHGL